MLPSNHSEYVTSIAHFYRGEMSRMITWRDRLDRTTNWAIAASAAMLSVTLSTSRAHHGVILCCMVLVFLLLAIESRRYRFFDISRARVRCLERNYFARLFVIKPEEVAREWCTKLHDELRCPHYTMTRNEALANRLRRNYIWIYVVLLVAWWLKISTTVLDAKAGRAEFVSSARELFDNASVGYVPGEVLVGSVLIFFCWLLFLTTRHRQVFCEPGSEPADL